ncbi:MAG: transglutaminase domain-containing protein [Planctomycetota bacterium]
MRPELQLIRLPLGGLLGELGSSDAGDRVQATYIDVGDQKLAHIMRLIREGSHHPHVVETARRIVSNVPDKDDVGEIRAVWDWLRENVRYVRDPIGMEVMQTAHRMLSPTELLPDEIAKRLPPPSKAGDCDEMGAVLAGALLRAIGYTVRIALWAKPRGAWQHIFTLAYAPQHKGWLPVDPTMKDKPFGWLPPLGRWTSHRFDDDRISEKRIIATGNGRTAAELEGFFDDLWKGIKDVAGNVWEGVKTALPAVATVGASLIPGDGAFAAPIVGNLVNSLVNKGAPNPSIGQAMQAMKDGTPPLAVIGAVAGQQVPGIGVFAQQALSSMLTSTGERYTYQLPPQPQTAAQQQQAQQYAQQQVGPAMAYQAARVAPAMADAVMVQHPQTLQYDPQPRPGQFYPLFAQQAQADYGPQLQSYRPPQYAPPQNYAPPQPQPAPMVPVQSYPPAPQTQPQWQPAPQAQWQQAPPPPQQQPPPQWQPAPQAQPQWQPAPPQLPPYMEQGLPPQQPQQMPWQQMPWQQPAPASAPAPAGPPMYYAPAYAGLLGEVFDDRGVVAAARAGETLAELAGLL